MITSITTPLHELTYEKVRVQLSQALGMAAWWMLCVVVPVVAITFGAIYGCIVGTASGAAAGITESKADLERWWEAIGK